MALKCAMLQVHIYLPENGHPATGLVRTIVKDSTDLDTSSFLDSDGHYGDNTNRNQLNSNPVDDGAWHMVWVLMLLAYLVVLWGWR